MTTDELVWVALRVIAIPAGLAALFVGIVIVFYRSGHTGTGVLFAAVAVAVLGWLASDLFLASWDVIGTLSGQGG